MFQCKEDIYLEDIKDLQPATWIIMTAFMLYANEHNLPCRITSLKSDREGINSQSKTHEDFRAIDFTSHGWSDFHIKRIIYKINNDYSDIAAISASDLKPRAIIHHDIGHGSHFHLQVRKDAKWHKFIK